MEPNELAAAAGRYRDMIYRVALHWCGHPQEAEDATQDTLLKLCTTHRHFADKEHLRSWLLRVTINHCKSRLRAPWHTRRLPLEEVPDAPVFDDPHPAGIIRRRAGLAAGVPHGAVLILL